MLLDPGGVLTFSGKVVETLRMANPEMRGSGESGVDVRSFNSNLTKIRLEAEGLPSKRWEVEAPCFSLHAVIRRDLSVSMVREQFQGCGQATGDLMHEQGIQSSIPKGGKKFFLRSSSLVITSGPNSNLKQIDITFFHLTLFQHI